MNVTDALCLALCAFWWGEWNAARKAKRTAERDSAAFKILYQMLLTVREKRRLVGPFLTITRSEKLEVSGETFTLSLRSEGDPNAYQPEVEEA